MNSRKREEGTMANLDQYRAVLDDLFRQRSQLQFKIGEIDSAIAALRKLMPEEEIVQHPVATLQPALVGVPGKYAGMGVRWAILNLLAEDAVGPMTATEIAEALQAGGITSTAKNFRGNVSAVLSDMNLKRDEVESAPNATWKLTQKGKDCWIHIKANRERGQTVPIAFEQPSVQ